jgi:cell division protease FtsH
MVGAAVEVARALQPSVVILEDCDLVAEERTFPGAHNPILFELLNAMDGVADDADLLFELTTNRADLLEPALAARPGRVDLAVEIPLPDADCRRRLLARYLEGLNAPLDDVDTIVERTEGITASFVKELVRAATVRALETGAAPPVVRDEHFATALDELLDESGALTARLLGGAADRPPPSTFGSMNWIPGAHEAMRMMQGMGVFRAFGVGNIDAIESFAYEADDEEDDDE